MPAVLVLTPATVLVVGTSATVTLSEVSDVPDARISSTVVVDSPGVMVVAPTLITGAITSETANTPVIIFLMILAFIILSSYLFFTARNSSLFPDLPPWESYQHAIHAIIYGCNAIINSSFMSICY